MKYLSQLVLYYSRHFIALLLALFTFFATPAAGQFLSDGVTPVTPIPNSNATLLGHIGSCLAEQPVTGLCTTWGDSSGFGAIPSWDVSNVTDFGNAFLNRTTFDGDVSRWDTSSARSLFRTFQNAQAFNQDVSQWDVQNVTNFNETFKAAQNFNQDISGWDVGAGDYFEYMFHQANAFNQDIRKWQIDSGDFLLNIFWLSPAMATAFGTHPFYADTPRREFFYAPDVPTLESLEFPTEPSVAMNFSRTTYTYNIWVPDRSSIDIKVRPSEFDNVGHPNAAVTIDGSAVLVPDAQGYVRHTVPITATLGVVQSVPIVVTAPDGVTQQIYTLNMTVNFIRDATIKSVINNCLAEEPVTGLCVNYSASSGHPVMPNWNVSNVTNFTHAFLNKTTFDGDISLWDMSNALTLYGMFQNAQAFNQDISQWDVRNVTGFNRVFHVTHSFNQDISGWDVSSSIDFRNMFNQATAFNQDISGWDVTASPHFDYMFEGAAVFNQDIRKWQIDSGDTLTDMFRNATAMTATYGTHPLYANTPRREFFYAPDVPTLESLEFPTEPSVAMNFSRTTYTYNIWVPDRSSIDIKVRPSEFDNVGHPNAAVTIDGSAVLVPDAQGYVRHTVPITATLGVVQSVPIVVTAPDGVTQQIYTLNMTVNFIRDATIKSVINNCLAEEPVTGLCVNYSASSGHPVMPNWNVSNVTNFTHAFLNKTTFDGDISLWDMSNALTLYGMFENAQAFNQDISQWDVRNVTGFNRVFHLTQNFNQDISGWDVSSSIDFRNMFNRATAFNQDISGWDVTASPHFDYMFEGAAVFNQDIRKWQIDSGDTLTAMFRNATAMTATYGTHPLYANTPRREFFYAPDVPTLEELTFPKNSLATINFNRNTTSYNVTIFDEKGIEIRVRPSEYDNVGHPNASVSIGGSGPLTLDAQGYATYAVPVTMTVSNPTQTVVINVISPDGGTTLAYTLNLSGQVIDDSNFHAFVNNCLAEDPVGGICPNWASGAGLPTMPNWELSDVTDLHRAFMNEALFDGDISKWDTSNVVTMWEAFSGATNFNQDISDWDVSSVQNFFQIFQDAAAFNHDIRKWPVASSANLTDMFVRANALQATFSGTPYFGNTPRASFFYAFDTTTLENLSFPNDPSISVSFNRSTRVYNLTVPDTTSIDIFLGVSDFSNVNNQTATVTLDTNPIALDPQGKALHTLPITGTIGSPQVVKIDVTASNGVTVGTYTLNLTVDFLTNANIAAAVNACLTEAPITGNCPSYSASSGRPIMPNWNVTHVTDMSRLFQNNANFDGNISAWDVSNVTTMQSMFDGAVAFDQDISPWDVGAVTDMTAMFKGAVSFDQALSVWNVSNVTNMASMFEGSVAFNSSLKNWDVSNVLDMSRMFRGAFLFDQDIGGWTVTNVADMGRMFNDARAFNQNIGTWRPQSLTNMASMFKAAFLFNQDISQWDVSTVTAMSGLFFDAKTFNQNIAAWDVSNVRDMSYMFSYSPFNQNIGGWNVGNVTSIAGMFESNTVFNQDISLWNTSNVTSMASTFSTARSFVQDISPWDTSSVVSFDNMFRDTWWISADLRRWEVGPTASLTDMFNGAINQHGNFSTHPFFGNTPRREFFYAPDVATLEHLNFPNEPNVAFTFNPATTTYNVQVPDKSTLDIGGWVTEYDNVQRANATVKIDGTPVTFNAQGILAHPVALNMTPNTPNQVVLVEVTSPDASTTHTITLNLTAAIITDTNLAAHVTGCLNEDPVAGLCPSYAASQLIPTMPLWKTTHVTDLSNVFQGRGNFDADISAWDTSGVTTLASAFASAGAFNQDISAWDTSKVTDMSSVFQQSTSFDQDIGGWDVNAVTSFVNMLDSASTFDQEIRGWNLNPAVTAADLTSMFAGATAMHATYTGTSGFANSPTLGFFNQSSDATLASLSVSSALSPISFSPGVQTYSVTVPYQTNATVNLTVNEFDHTNLSYASAAINGSSVSLNTTGSAAASVPLTATPNTAQPVNIVVTAPDGSTLTYTVNITRQSNDASLSSLTSSVGSLSPAFAPSTMAYGVNVPHATTTLTLTPTVNEPNATVVVNSGNPITLSVGANPIPVLVTSQDGSTTLTYTVTITRAPSSDASLSSLTSSIGTLSPSFAPGTTAYSLSVAHAVTTLSLTPGVNDPNATAVVNSGNPIALSVGANPIPVEVTAQDGTTKITYTVTVTRAPSSDASLSSLTSSIGTLSPSFAPGTTAYSLSVAHAVTTLSLTPGVNDPNATAVVNSGNPIALSVGANPIPVEVTAQDGTTTITYTVTITRAPSSDASLSSLTSSIGTLSPSFAPGTTAYSLSVAHAVTTLSLTPGVNDPNATAVVNSGNPIALSVGANPIPVEVTAQDGTTKITYMVTITRAPSSDASLSSLTSSIGTLSPSFAPGTTAYSLSVAHAVTTLSLTPGVNDPNATAVVNSGNPIALSVGANPIPVEVTAQDGTTTITYTVTITRAPSSDASLSSLTSSIGTLSPSFAPGTTAYSLSVAHAVTTLSLTPGVNDPNATAVVNSGNPIALSVGANPIPVEVTAQDGTTKITYMVTITRAPSSDASLSSLTSSIGTLSPSFAPGTTAYSLSVAHAVTTLSLTPGVNDPNATAVVNSGNPIALSVGANPIPVEVTAQDGTTKITYTVTITRGLSSDASLSSLTSSIGTLSPSFAPGTTAYSLSVAHAVTTLSLTPGVNDPNATAVVNSGNPIALSVGANPIPVEVTAQDGTTKITYMVTITRAATLQVVITGPTTPVSGAFSVGITFSHPVTQFTMADVTIVNGTATAMTGSGTTYTLTVTPSLASNVSISLPAGRVVSTAGLSNAASNVLNIQAGTPATALAAAKTNLEQMVLGQAQKALSSQASIDQRMIRSGMQRLVQRQRLARQQSNRFLPLDVDGTAQFNNGEFRLNGDFFALASVEEQSAEVVSTGSFNFVSDPDGNFSGYFNGRTALEVQLSLDTALGYFLGVEVGRTGLSGTFAGRQDSYGVNAGGYVIRSFNDVSYITGFAALGRNKNQLDVSNGTLQVDSVFDSTTLRLGASATGVLRMVGIEIWPELSFSYARSRVGTQAVAAQAYGLTSNNLSLAGGNVEMGQLMLMPQVKWSLGDGRDGAAVANFSLAPRLTCRVVRGAGEGRSCGAGAGLGFSAASGNGFTLFNATVEFDNVAGTKNGSLTFNVEHNF